MLKSAMDAVTCSQKHFVRHHTTSWLSMWTGVWYAGTTTQGCYCTAQTLPTPIIIPTPRTLGEKPVSDGRVLIDLGTCQSLDEGQRDMLKGHGLVVNIVNS